MNTATQSIVVGILAGIASAMLVLSAFAVPLAYVILVFVSSMPVLIAGIGWSNRTGIVAVVTGAIIIGVATTPFVALVFSGALLVPAAWIAHLTNLARPADEIGGRKGELAWYPLSHIMLYICGISAVLFSLYSLVVAGDQELRDTLILIFSQAFEQAPEPGIATGASVEATVDQLLALAPFFLGAGFVLLYFFGWYSSARIVELSGRAKRPRENVPANLRMPRTAIPILAAGLLIYFLGGGLSPAGLATTGAFTAGFTMSGLAMLHDATRGKPWRQMALWLAYAAVLIISLPLVAFFIAGLFGTARTTANTSSNDNDTTT